jgi:hypothetical protein
MHPELDKWELIKVLKLLREASYVMSVARHGSNVSIRRRIMKIRKELSEDLVDIVMCEKEPPCLSVKSVVSI